MPSALIDRPLPSFSMKTVKQGDRVVTEKEMLGQIHLINVWATWCPSCHVEHAYLMALSDKATIPIVGVNYKDNCAAARELLEDYGDPYQYSVADTQGVLGIDLGVYGAPETYLVDQHGVIRYKRVGVMNEKIWQQKFLPIIKQLNKTITGTSL